MVVRLLLISFPSLDQAATGHINVIILLHVGMQHVKSLSFGIQKDCDISLAEPSSVTCSLHWQVFRCNKHDKAE